MYRGILGAVLVALLAACSNAEDEARPEPASELAVDEVVLAAERLCAAVEREPSNEVAFEEFERDFQRELRSGLDEQDLSEAIDAECGRLISALAPPPEPPEREALSEDQQAAEHMCRSMETESSADLAYLEFEANLQRQLALGLEQATLFEALLEECGDLLAEIAPAFGPNSDFLAGPQPPSAQTEEPTEGPQPNPTLDSNGGATESASPGFSMPDPAMSPPPTLDLAPEPETPRVVAMNETFTLESFQVTVRSLTEDATSEVLSHSSANPEPSNGLYGLITFDATYVGTGSRNPAAAIHPVLVRDGIQYRDIDCSATVIGGFWETPELEAGGTARGVTACFDHPGFASGTELFLTETLSQPSQRVYVRFR